MPLAYLSKTGVTSPAYYEPNGVQWLRSFFAGLLTTSTGSPKVVEARDFTGEAVIDCDPATVEKGEDGQDVWRGRGGFVKGVKAIPGLPDGAPVFVGFLDEAKYKNSAVPDLNGNGRTDDRFALVLFKGADGRMHPCQ